MSTIIPEPDRILSGHTSAETAYIVLDYPFGFRLRCKRRCWIETSPTKGDRFCTQTTNPKVAGETWNRPKRSTYAAVGVMFLDGDGHVQWTGLGIWAPQEQITHFFNFTHGKLTDQQHKALRAIVAFRRAYAAKQKAAAEVSV